MKKIEVTNQGEKISEKDIEKFEQNYNVQIPEDYKKFLLKFNGGIPHPNYYKCENKFGINVITKEKGEDVLQITSLTEFHQDFCFDAFDLYDGCDITEEILENIKYLHVIGDDLAGDTFLISLAGINKGKIYFVSHQDSCDSNLYIIANSFDNFFNNLQEDPTVTYFEKCCEKNDIEGVRKLLDKGLNVETLIPPKYGYSLLSIAIEEGKIDIAKLLIERGAEIKRVFWRIAPKQELFDLLLSNGADINERNYNNETPIFLAVANTRIEVIKLLIKNGADVLAKDDKGNLALDLRIKNIKTYGGNEETDETVKILKEAMQKY